MSSTTSLRRARPSLVLLAALVLTTFGAGSALAQSPSVGPDTPVTGEPTTVMPGDGATPAVPNPNVTGAQPVPYDHDDHPLIRAQTTPQGVTVLDGQPDLAGHVTVLADGTGVLEFRCPPSELDYYARLLAVLGDSVHVEGPPELVERLRAIGQDLVRRYEKR